MSFPYRFIQMEGSSPPDCFFCLYLDRYPSIMKERESGKKNYRRTELDFRTEVFASVFMLTEFEFAENSTAIFAKRRKIVDELMLKQIKEAAELALLELIEVSGLKKGDLLVIGCSSSEIAGLHIGHGSSLETAEAVYEGIRPVLKERGIDLAAQCCEHLNRALIMEKAAAAARGYDIVNVVPQPKAGGSFASVVYRAMKDPAAVEEIRADAGMDIGDTLIGMHLKKVAVPVRLTVKKIGQANLVCARTRPKYIGGGRACYDETLQ